MNHRLWTRGGVEDFDRTGNFTRRSCGATRTGTRRPAPVRRGTGSALSTGMPNITHIVVPVDFEAASEAALAYARTLAAHFHASLTVVHVYDDPFARAAFAPEVYGMVPSGPAEAARQDVHARLGALVHPGEIARGSSVEVLSGPTAPAIVDYAARCGASLIVMGTHGRRGLAHAVLGSVAERVLRTAPCPVLTVQRRPEPVVERGQVSVATAH
jgi:nucleotide-binding universal stress UspA family protein